MEEEENNAMVRLIGKKQARNMECNTREMDIQTATPWGNCTPKLIGNIIAQNQIHHLVLCHRLDHELFLQ